ncbi:bifunctional UDP-sugar hydrolase/5'-nucleotidase [Azovibrio restrictus]|uniref:bifunctional metallophosphatase/5'-nucleotidase n=1 Tax=Azovibrio restrictus TaxID=146938 RepID=UPI0026F2DEED|nr:5'-nucleotidase C-terminal domain-containing protein [Azovibrio restrictus]MDD3484639.1 5'-nucleotidase C-terminal domain-containing protein [Azovibrio restrictus]
MSCRALRLLFSILIACLGLACSGVVAGSEPSFPPLELRIAHLNDHHAHLEGQSGAELLLDGVPTRVELGGFARLVTLFKAQEGTPGLLKLHAGDALSGSLYYTLFRGAADAHLMNQVCFDAFVPGNHEFDGGDEGLRNFLDTLAGGDCATPVLSANVQPLVGTALAPGGRRYLRPYVIREVEGVRVGIIGITAAAKTMQSSRPLDSTRFLDELGTAQATVDELKAQGVRHIVLLTHQGHARDLAMAARLSEVDVIIGGDSHTLLGDFSSLGLAGAGPYPAQVRNREGDLVCVGQAWEYGKAWGLMRISFDARGRVRQCGGEATLVLGDRFEQRNGAGQWQLLEGPAHQQLLARLQETPGVRVAQPDAAAAAMLAGYSGQMDAARARVIAQVAQPFCLVGVPGEAGNRSAAVAGCETAHTLARGSAVAELVATAFLHASPGADLALTNAGGVRLPLAPGPFRLDTAFNLLPFDNLLVELDLRGEQLLGALEDGVSQHLDQGQGGGSHPYGAGVRWRLDMSQPRGQRFSQVEVRDRASGAWLPLELERTYRLVTHDFIATGRDGYHTLGRLQGSAAWHDTYLSYTQALVDFAEARGLLPGPEAASVSHQQVRTRSGQLLP